MSPIIYLAFANSSDNPLYQLSAEERSIREILRERYVNKGHFLVESNSYSKLDDLRKDLTQFKDQIFLFHYSGHASGKSVLLPSGRAAASGLGKMLGELPNLKLVILNGCETQAQVDQLLALGVPAVIATHTKIEDRLARKFSEQFYESLVQGYSIEEAYTQWVNYLETLGEDAKAIVNPRDLEEDDDYIEQLNQWGLFYKKGGAESLQATLPKVSPNEKNRKRIYLLLAGVLLALASLGGLSIYNSVQPFDFVFEVVDRDGQASRALTGELDKLNMEAGDSLMMIEKETPEFSLTQTDPPIMGRINVEGNIYFEDLPHSLRNNALGYSLKSKYYQVAGRPESIKMKGNRGKLTIERTEVLCCIKGRVRIWPDLIPLEGATVVFQDTAVKTNAAGYFEFRIPEHAQKRIQKVSISHPDMKSTRHESIQPELIFQDKSPWDINVDPK
ncbi:MAG: CHAT domain-containing protein [Bacteroidia bacterium]|nr:CHAT domain-containing protein [Bacteroidia bacterium]